MNYGVITICLNSAKTIAMTIESVFAQTVLPDQFVFVDGGSDDGTLDIIGMAEKTGQQTGVMVKCVHQPAPASGIAGIPNAWNLGLRELATDIVFIVNSDDWYEARAAEKVLDALDANPDAGILTSPVRFWQPGMVSYCVRGPRSPIWFPFLMPVLHPGCFVRRSVYEQVGLFDERYQISADYDFVYRCHRAGINTAQTPEVLVNMMEGGTAGQNRAIARQETLDIALRHGRVGVLPRIAHLLRAVTGR